MSDMPPDQRTQYLPPQGPPPHPGLYHTPNGVLFWNGAQWTQPMPAPRKRTPVFGPIIAVAGVIAAVIFAFFLKPSETLFGSNVECGGKNAISLATTNRDDVEAGLDEKAGESGEASGAVRDAGESFINSCYSQAHTDLWIAGICLVAGLGLGWATSVRERAN